MAGKRVEGARSWKSQVDETKLAASYHVEASQPSWVHDTYSQHVSWVGVILGVRVQACIEMSRTYVAKPCRHRSLRVLAILGLGMSQ